MNNYDIIDNFGYNEDYSYLNSAIESTLKHEDVSNAVFSIVFVDEKTIQEMNRDYRGIDRVTDVISFAFEDNEKVRYNTIRVLGDIYICIPRMKEQAVSYGHSEKRELAFLTVHGLLHLLGYDHQTEAEEKIMFGLQELILDGENIKR